MVLLVPHEFIFVGVSVCVSVWCLMLFQDNIWRQLSSLRWALAEQKKKAHR